MFSPPHDTINLYILPLALLLDFIFGEVPARFHPLCWFGRWTKKQELFWKKNLGKTFLAGSLATLSAIALPLALILILYFSLSSFSRIFSDSVQQGITGGMTIFFVYLCLAPKSLLQHGLAIHRACTQKDLPQARYALSMIVGRDTHALDRDGVLRAAIESISENFTDGILSTLFWATVGLLLGGHLGCILLVTLHRLYNTLDALWGKKNDDYRYFGTMAARTDDFLNYLPARISLLIIGITATLCPFASGRQAFTIGWKYRYSHPSPNSPWSEAAYAGALHLKLGGPISYKSIPAPYPYLGEGTLSPSIKDLSHSLTLTLGNTITSLGICEAILLIG